MKTACQILGIAAACLVFEVMCVFGAGFQPGWANGWPYVSKHTVFAAFMAGMLFLIVVTAGVAVLVVSCSCLQRLVKKDFIGWGTLSILLIIWSAIALYLSIQAFPLMHAAIATDWP